MNKKVLIAKPNYRKFSPTGYQMLLDKGYDVVATDLDRDYFLEELLPMVGDIDACIANCEPWGEEAMSAAPNVKILARDHRYQLPRSQRQLRGGTHHAVAAGWSP